MCTSLRPYRVIVRLELECEGGYSFLFGIFYKYFIGGFLE